MEKKYEITEKSKGIIAEYFKEISMGCVPHSENEEEAYETALEIISHLIAKYISNGEISLLEAERISQEIGEILHKAYKPYEENK